MPNARADSKGLKHVCAAGRMAGMGRESGRAAFERGAGNSRRWTTAAFPKKLVLDAVQGREGQPTNDFQEAKVRTINLQ